MSADGGGGGGGAGAMFGLVAILRRYWWLVLATVLFSVLAAIAATLTASTVYTARSSLILASNDRAPDQDAVLAQGFVTYFNDPAYQSQLLANPKIGEGVTFEARAAASSPIFLVDATAADAESARSAASAAAVAFRTDVNRVREQRNQAAIADLEERINAILITGDDSQAAVMQVTEMQNRILQLQADRVNLLQELQLDGGVTQNSASAITNILLALLGGLLLGVLAAVAADSLPGAIRSRRLSTR
jgi:hypothetical protein